MSSTEDTRERISRLIAAKREHPGGGHLAFGYGIHRCLGAQLAATQAEIALTRLFARFPKLRVGRGERGRARWQANPRHRGLETLIVRLR